MSGEAPAAPAAAQQAATPPPAPAAAAKPAEAAKPTEQKPEPKADAWAKLTAAEQKVRKEREEIKAEREAFAKERAELAAKGDPVAALKERVKRGEFDEALGELGVDYVAWTKARIAKMGGKAPTANQQQDIEKVIEDRVAKALAKRDEEAKKQTEESQSKAWASAWSTFQDVVKQTASTNELLAVELADDPETVEKTLRILAQQAPHLTFEQAAAKYEEYLVDKTKKTLQIGKVKALYAPPSSETAKQTETASPRAGTGQKADEGGPRTLTNALAAEPSTSHVEAPPPSSRTAQIRAERMEVRKRMGRAVGRLNQG